MPGGDQQVIGSGGEDKRVRLPGVAVRPLYEAPLKVTRIDERDRIPSWVVAEEILCPESYYPSSGDGQAEIRQPRIETHHPMPNHISIAVRDDVDEGIRIVGPNEVVVLDCSNVRGRLVGTEA